MKFYTLRSGDKVTSKDGTWPTQYTNRTQAARAAAKIPSAVVIQRGRPFYVRLFSEDVVCPDGPACADPVVSDYATRPRLAGEGGRMNGDCIEVWAVPGRNSIIDEIHPVTGLTLVCGKDAAAVLASEPLAVRMSWTAWREAAHQRQQTPITWSAVPEEVFYEMLEVLPPAFLRGGAFLVGEPADHCVVTGSPRFAAFRQRGDLYYASNRPLTIAEMKAACTSPATL